MAIVIYVRAVLGTLHAMLAVLRSDVVRVKPQYFWLGALPVGIAVALTEKSVAGIPMGGATACLEDEPELSRM